MHEPQPGFGAACFAGLTAATAEIVCFMDCDASFDPRELPRVADPVAAGSADLVLGARRRAPGAAWPLHARAANAVLAFELRRRTGVHVTDLGPMRAARREPLLALGIEDRRFGWPLEMVLRRLGRRLAPRRGAGQLPGPRGPLEDHRDRPRHGARDPRHDPRPVA